MGKSSTDSELRKLLGVLQHVRETVYKDMPIQQLCIFLAAAVYDVTMADLEKKLDMPSGSVSRNVKKLSVWRDRSTGERQGMDLVYIQPNEYERRQMDVKLSENGKKVLGEIVNILAGKR